MASNAFTNRRLNQQKPAVCKKSKTGFFAPVPPNQSQNIGALNVRAFCRCIPADGLPEHEFQSMITVPNQEPERWEVTIPLGGISIVRAQLLYDYVSAEWRSELGFVAADGYQLFAFLPGGQAPLGKPFFLSSPPFPSIADSGTVAIDFSL